MFGISGEHLLILGIVLLIFGPRRLPELGNTLGKAIRNFKDAVSGVEEAKFRRVEEDPSHRTPPLAQAQAQPQAHTVTASTAAASTTPSPTHSDPAASSGGRTDGTSQS